MLLAVILAAIAAWRVVRGADDGSPDGPSRGSEAAPAAPADESADTSLRQPPAAPAAAKPTQKPRAQPAAVGPESAPEPKGAPAIRGSVRFADGSAAAGATVRAWDVRGAAGGLPRTEIGSAEIAGGDASFEISVPAGETRYVVYASCPGFETVGAVVARSADATVRPEPVHLVLGVGGVLTGTVYGADGAPLAEREVQLFPADRRKRHAKSGRWKFWTEPVVWDHFAATTRTDAEGRYRFSGVAVSADDPQPRAAVVQDDDGGSWASDEVAFAAAGEAAVRDVRIGVTPWTGDSVDPPGVVRSVTVRVLAPDGSDVTDATVRYAAFSEARIVWWPATSGATGTWAAAIPPGDFVDDDALMRLSVAAPGYAPWSGVVTSREVTVRLETATLDERGRIAGELVGDGTELRLPGYAELRVIDLVSFVRRRYGVGVAADGSFAVEGVGAGPKLASFDEMRNWREIAVPPGGQSWDRFLTETALEAVHAPEVVERTLSRIREIEDEIGSILRRSRAERGVGDDARIAELERDAARLRRQNRAAVVVDVPGGGAGWITYREGDLFVTARVSNGRAEFPALFPGRHAMTILRPGAEAEVVHVEARLAR
ncbi:MAG: hypothetical protein HMLKMBBP_00148 [Planctomycetes bacterium]|nr:hypothetical protein [Planctomycetota bacterium]